MKSFVGNVVKIRLLDDFIAGDEHVEREDPICKEDDARVNHALRLVYSFILELTFMQA